MKKLLLLTAAVAVFAQTASAKIGLGVEAGVNFANTSRKLGDEKLDTKSITGFKAGAIVNIGLPGKFSLQPGVFFTQKGSKTESEDSTVIGGKTTLNYIEVPVNVMYDFNIGPGNLFVGAGPYVGFALSGTTKWDDDSSEDIKFGSKDEETNGMDFGANINAGYKLPLGLFLRLNYGFGLGNLSNVDNTTAKNGVFSASIGYMFR